MKILLAGHGRMGSLIEKTINDPDSGFEGYEITAIFDIDNAEELQNTGSCADIIIDFSNPGMLDKLLEYALRTKTPLLTGTTGFTPEQSAAIAELSRSVPVIASGNFSLGVTIFRHLLEQIAPTLKGWDIELTETHHNKKVDAPSGTANMLLDALDPKGEYTRVYGREGICGARTSNEIGVHSLRGGTVAGEHTVDFYGTDEVLEITHKAGSRQIFVNGALKTAAILVAKEPGLYTMDQIIFG